MLQAQNPGFENNLTSWSNNGIGTFTSTSTVGNFRSGAKAIQLATSSTSDSKAFNASMTVTVPAAGTNYITVMAYMKGAAPAEVTVGMYDNTLSIETKSTTLYTPSGAFTLIEKTFPATNGSVYYPYLYGRSTTGAAVTMFFDDVIIYTSTQNTTDVTAPNAPSTFTTSAAGTTITLNFIPGTDAQSGIDGVLILRRASTLVAANQAATAQTWYATNALIGPTAAGTLTVVYNGAAISSYTDNPGATGFYTYFVYMRDKAYNYTASHARIFVFNGTGLAASTANNSAIDDLYLPATNTFTLQSSSTVSTRAGCSIKVDGTVIMQGNLNNNQGAAALTFRSGSLYRYNRNGGGTFNVTTATWDNGSECRIDGITNAAPPAGLAQSFANFTWNSPSQTTVANIPNNFTARQNCLLVSTGSGSLVFNGLNTIGENFTQTGGTASYAIGNTIFMNGSLAQTIDVVGPLEGLTISNTSTGVSLLRSLQFNDTLSLLVGNFTSGAFTLTAANAAAISRTNGTLATAPNFIGNNDIIYRAAVTTGVELPTATTIIRNLSLLLSSSGTVIQNAPARVNGNLLLGLGYLQTSTTNILAIADNATSSGASNSSFVSGPMRKIGNDAFIFPVGKNTYYAAIAISAPANNTSQFTAEYFFTDPDPFYNVASHDPTLVGISRCEYWILDRTAGADAVSVTLSWDTTECGSNYITVPADLRVARWDAGASIWRDEGNGGITGGLPTGTIISGAAVVNFSPFTLATVNPINPLPVELLYFDAYAVDQHVALRWETATEQHSDYFTIQRSHDGLTFEDVLQTDAAGFSTQRILYTEKDLHPYNGTSYYRIIQTDFNGFTHTYAPVSVHFDNNTPRLTTQYTIDGVLVSVNGFDDEALIEVTLYDATGRVYWQQGMRNAQFIQLPNTLATGIYFLRVNSNDLILNKTVFVK